MKKLVELLSILLFLLASASAAFAASGQIQGPGSFFFIMLTIFLGYCAMVVGAQLIAFLHARLGRRRS